MTIEQTAPLSAETVQAGLLGFLASKSITGVDPGQDLFAAGLVSSMFAMELVVHLESSYQIAILGGDLKLDNFRTVTRMTELVLRLAGG